MAHVSLRNVVKHFDDTEAVRGIDLDIADKDFVVQLGPSGCGKSTTLRIVAGLEEITAGEIAVDGEVVNDVPPKDRDMAMVFQNYALYPHMTVYENMSFGLRLKRYPKDEIARRVKEAARILDITELLDRKPRQLSGGQRRAAGSLERADRLAGAGDARGALPAACGTRASDLGAAPGASDRCQAQRRRARRPYRCRDRGGRAAGDGDPGLFHHQRRRG